VNPDLAKAERALEFGDRAEASVHAWNALETIDRVEAGWLRRIAEQLEDDALLAELDRRGFAEKSPEVERSPRFNKFSVLPIVILLSVVLLAVNDLLVAENGAPDIEDVRTAKVMPQVPPALTRGDGIWLVRVGNKERVPLRKLAVDLTHRYDIPVGVLPALDPLPESAVDDVGRFEDDELDGDELVTLLATRYGARGRATIIGITDFAMHGADSTREPFMLRSRSHYAVISTAQLGAGFFDRRRGHTRYERTRKLVGRSIGFLYFMQPVSSDPHSLVRSEMSGTGDIDALREQL